MGNHQRVNKEGGHPQLPDLDVTAPMPRPAVTEPNELTQPNEFADYPARGATTPQPGPQLPPLQPQQQPHQRPGPPAAPHPKAGAYAAAAPLPNAYPPPVDGPYAAGAVPVTNAQTANVQAAAAYGAPVVIHERAASPFAVRPANLPPVGGYAERSPRIASIPDDNAVTMEPTTRKNPAVGTEDKEAKPLSTFGEIKLILKDFIHRNEKVIWWLHTAYALCLGAFVASFASKGFENARKLTLSLCAAWLLVVFFFRFFGTGSQQDFMTAWPGMRRRFFVMTYLMKNLFQGMLFYLLPFYWKSASIEASTYVIPVALSACAVLSTLDLVFDRVLLRFKTWASLFFALTLFGCMNLVVPALLPNTPIVVTYCVATGFSIATFMLFHLPLTSLRRPVWAGTFVAAVLLGVLGAYTGRRAMPPVPLTLKDAGVGPKLREDGSLQAEVRVLRLGDISDLYAVSDVQVIGKSEHFKHVWRFGSRALNTDTADAAPSKERNVVRVASKLPVAELPSNPEGKYTVDIVTDGDQIVGRIVFEIKP